MNAKGRQMGPRGGQREAKGAQREAKGRPRDAQGRPRGGSKRHRDARPGQGAKPGQMPNSIFGLPLGRGGEIAGSREASGGIPV